jgi:hypothetical protein
MDDSIVAILALDVEQRGLFEEKLNKNKWSQFMDQQGLYGEHWLLCYDANIKKWITNTGRDYVKSDSRFNYLKKTACNSMISLREQK